MLSNIFALTSTTATAAKGLDTVELILGIALMVMALFLIVAVLLQSGKDSNNLSGAISGSADTFFSKSKAGTFDKILSRATAVISILFGILVIVMYIFVS